MANRQSPEAELILYAVPVGPLAEAIDGFFGELALRPTRAQDYPPHCTLTGFFHDDEGSIEHYVAAASSVVRPVGVGVRLRTTEWIGLEVHSPDLQQLAHDFARRVAPLRTRRDALRLKDWLHVSLAYGHAAAEADELTDLAISLIDPGAEVNWHLRLYERRDDRWIVHGSWPLPRHSIAAEAPTS